MFNFFFENGLRTLKKLIENDIKVRTKLGQTAYAQFPEYKRVFESDMMSYETVLRWIKKYLTGTESV